MEHRRIIGMDLGVVSDHVVAICDHTGTTLAKRRCRPTRSSLEAIEAAALAEAPEGTRLEVVSEPTGAAWMPVAVFFCRRGHTVYRVSSQKAADLRRFLSRHAKSNAIDALTLARLAIVDPEHLVALELPSAELAALTRRARAADALTEQIAARKTRLRELARHAITVDTVFTNKIGNADIAVLERYGDPRAILRLGPKRLASFIARVSRGQHGAARAAAWLAVARDALELYDAEPAVPLADIAAELATEAPHPAVGDRARHPCACPGAGLRQGRSDRTGPQPARGGRGRRTHVGGGDGQPRPLHQRGRLQGLHWPRSPGQRHRRCRRQGPGHVEGGLVAPARPAGVLGQRGSAPRPAAGPGVLGADGGAGSASH